jgi:Na+/H+ antiporter NhaA
MALRHRASTSLARRLAAAAAVQDPSLLTRLGPEEERRPGSETGAALLLVGAVALALAWCNSPWAASYDAVWHARVALTVGPWTLGADLRTWIDEGLMTLFFLVVGLEAKRERDVGALRDGRRLAAPVLAGLAGMGAAAAAYVAVTAGGPGAGGRGAAVSTDTALALGALTIAAGRRGEQLRVFLLTLLVVDDVVALMVISFVYPGRIDPSALVAATALLGLLLSLRTIAGRQLRATGNSAAALFPLSVLTGIALWLALFESGIDPVISGLLIGLLTNAYERDAPGLAPAAAISPNDRLQHRLHPLTSRLVVPVFALANAGLRIDGHLLAAAATSPVTWGIVLAYVVGKPLGIVAGASAAAGSLGRAELRGTALSAGIGFTVALLIASRAFHGALLDQAKVGILATALLAPVLAAVALAPRRGSAVRVGSPCPAR